MPKDIVVAYISGGYLAAACLASEHDEGVDFPPDLRTEEDFETWRVNDVPDKLARDLCRQGSSDQEFADGYDAAGALAAWVLETKAEPVCLDGSGDAWDDGETEAEQEADDDADRDEPDDEDYVTSDYVRFYSHGGPRKLLVAVDGHGEGVTWIEAVSAHMDREQFWPNVWYLGERGDWNLLDISTGEFSK